jgi:putative membrane protein
VLVEWSLVAVLVMAVTAALLQLTLSLYVRNILADAASDAARHAALVGASDAEANARVQQLCHGALRANYPTKSEVSHLQRGSVSLVQVQVSAPLPVIGLWSPTGSVVVRGHAVDQRSYQR